MFDILKDSAFDIASGLLKEAWGGEFPEGGLDFPSGCVLSQCTDVDSDLHIELGMVEAPEAVSDIPWLADLTHGEVQGPRDSDSPFKFLNGEGDLPGMFGTALKAYGQVIALLNEYGVAYDNYDKWFRAQWGIDVSTDLSMAIPVLRSHGKAMWGGLSRKLAPAAFSNLATSKQVRVRWHNKRRVDIGEDKLVDWPRLTAIAQTIGGYLLVEDKHAKKKRFDFKIVTKEIPNAPSRPGDILADFPHPKTWEVRTVANSALQYLQGYRAASLHLARHALGTTGTLNIHSDVEIPADAVAAFIKEHHIPPAPIDLGEYDDSGVFDFADEEPHKPKVNKSAPNITIYSAFAAAIKPRVALHWKELPPSHSVKSIQDTLYEKEVAERGDAENLASELIKKVVPDDFLLRVFRIVCLAKKSRGEANEFIGSLLKALHAPRSIFSNHDFVSVSTSIKNNKACWGWMLEEIRKQISANVYDKGIHMRMTSALWRILSSNANGDVALAEIIRQRKTWWANEYIRRAKHNKERRVIYQIKSRLFRATQVVIDGEGGARVNLEHAALVGALANSARAFLRKKRAFKFNAETVVEPGSRNLITYAKLLDDTYHPTTKWVDGVDDYIRSVGFLVDDVRDMMQFVASGMNDLAFSPSGDLADNEDNMSDISSVGEPEVSQYPDEEVITQPAEDNGFDDFFGSDEDDDDIFDTNTAGTVDLVGELAEDCGHVAIQDRMAAVAKYGRFVSHDQVKNIVEELHKAHIKKLADKSGVLDNEADDIVEAR